MKILIINNRFYPINMIGAFRIEAFAKYFQQAGHSVTVVTDGEADEMKLWSGCNVYYVKDPLITLSYRERCVKEGKKWVLRRIANGLLVRLTADGKFIWRWKAYKKAASLCEANSFDVVLSSFGLLAPHMVAYKLRKKGYRFSSIRRTRSHTFLWSWKPRKQTA